MEVKEKKTTVQSVERAIAILKCFQEHSELGITEISRMLSLHKSTAYGLVSTLEGCKMLEQDEISGKYKLGIELFHLGTYVNINLRNIVSPYLNELVTRCQETVNLVVPDGDQVMFIEKKESPHSMRICTTVGQKVPFYCTAVGKAIMAFMPEQERLRILEKTQFVRYTDNTLRSTVEVQKQLIEIRQKGFAIDNEELEYGLICVGVALRNRDGIPVGGMSVSGPATRMTDGMLQKASDLLLDYAKQIRKKL